MMSGALYSPPRPPTPAKELGWFGILKTLRGNAIQMWPQAAYEQAKIWTQRHRR